MCDNVISQRQGLPHFSVFLHESCWFFGAFFCLRISSPSTFRKIKQTGREKKNPLTAAVHFPFSLRSNSLVHVKKENVHQMEERLANNVTNSGVGFCPCRATTHHSRTSVNQKDIGSRRNKIVKSKEREREQENNMQVIKVRHAVPRWFRAWKKSRWRWWVWVSEQKK